MLGKSEGETVRILDGETLGSALGISDGESLETTPGKFEGKAIGILDGEVLGSALGTWLEVGAVDGDSFGSLRFAHTNFPWYLHPEFRVHPSSSSLTVHINPPTSKQSSSA